LDAGRRHADTPRIQFAKSEKEERCNRGVVADEGGYALGNRTVAIVPFPEWVLVRTMAPRLVRVPELIGNDALVRLLIDRGAIPNTRDQMWDGTTADWARHEGHAEVEAYLRGLEARKEH
jgi:hypothetical protein